MQISQEAFAPNSPEREKTVRKQEGMKKTGLASNPGENRQLETLGSNEAGRVESFHSPNAEWRKERGPPIHREARRLTMIGQPVSGGK